MCFAKIMCRVSFKSSIITSGNDRSYKIFSTVERLQKYWTTEVITEVSKV